MLRRSIASLAAVALLSSVALPALAKDKFVYGVPSAISSAVANFAFAKELGYFDQENLDVELVPLAGSSVIIPQLLSGQIHASGASLEPLVIARQPGKQNFPLKFVYNYLRNSVWEFAVPADSPVKTVADLKGKTIGVVSLGSGNVYTTRAILAASGVDPKGVTLQPVQDAGRNEAYDATKHRLTVSEIRRRIALQSGLFTLDDVVPVPCNPDTLAMAYALRGDDGTLQPLTRFLDPKTLVEGSRNTIVFERDESLKDQVFKLFSTNHSPESQASCLSALMCCLPQIAAPSAMDYTQVFRVLIVQFMDARGLDIRALKKSCIHMALPDGRMVPFESHNLFYRDERGLTLEALRAELGRFHAGRVGAG